MVKHEAYSSLSLSQLSHCDDLFLFTIKYLFILCYCVSHFFLYIPLYGRTLKHNYIYFVKIISRMVIVYCYTTECKLVYFILRVRYIISYLHHFTQQILTL